MYKRGKIVAIVLSNEAPEKHKVLRMRYTDSYLQAFLGGRGFNSSMLYMLSQRFKEKVTHWKDPRNVVCISGGLFAGTDFPSSGRTTISVLNSPVTKAFSDGNLGGHFGPALRLAGVDLIVIIGKAKTPTSIFISKTGQVSFHDASQYVGYGISASESSFVERLNTLFVRRENRIKAEVLTVGMSGMRGVFCGIVMHELRAAGGGGTGAVLGNKNIKCIGVEHRRGKGEQIAPSNYELWRSCRESAINHIKSHPVFDTFSKYGTTSLVEIHAGLNYLPTNNWMKSNSHKWPLVSGRRLLELEHRDLGGKDLHDEKLEYLKSHNHLYCRNCPICCSGIDKVEYETLNCLGPKLGIYDLNWIRRINSMYMNDRGLDVIQSTSILSALMEMTERGILVTPQIKFGDKAYAERFLAELSGGMKLEGTTIAAHFLNGFEQGMQTLYNRRLYHDIDFVINATAFSQRARELEIRHGSFGQMCRNMFFVNSKGNALSGVYLSQENKGVALATATSTRGADHLRSLPTLATYASWYIGKDKSLWKRIKTAFKASKIPWKAIKIMSSDRKALVGDLWHTYQTLFGVPSHVIDKWKESGFLLNQKQNSGWGSMIKYTQECYAAADALSTCKFTTSWRFGVGPVYQANGISSLIGKSFSSRDVLTVGERINAVERMLLVFSSSDKTILDTVSRKFFVKTKDKLIERDLNDMMIDFYRECSYDRIGVPSRRLVISEVEPYLLEEDYDNAKTIIRTWTDTNAS